MNVGPAVVRVLPVVGQRGEVERLYQASAAKAGISMSIKREPVDGFWDNAWLKRPFWATDTYVSPYQTYIKSLLHETLIQREKRKAG